MRVDPSIVLGALLVVGGACMLAGYVMGCFIRDEHWQERPRR